MSGKNIFDNTTMTNDFRSVSSLANNIFLAMAMFTLSFMTVSGNTIVIYALRTNRHLRTVM